MSFYSNNSEYIFKLLSEKNVFDKDQIRKAQELAHSSEGKLNIIDALKKLEYVDDGKIMSIFAEAYGLETIDLKGFKMPAGVESLISADIVHQYNVLPIKHEDGIITVAMSDPSDIETLDSLRYLLKCDVEAVIAPESQIKLQIERQYGSTDEKVYSFLDNIEGRDVALFGDSKNEEEEETDEDAPIIKLVSLIIMEAHKRNASDIHIEPLAKKFRIRYRIDGVLMEVEGPPKYLQANVVSRLKIMAKLDITEKRVPQDGRIIIKLLGKELDLRVSSIPTSHGESIVMRILDKSNVLVDISSLGFLDADIEVIKKIISMPDGIFLVTGPTGSGKTTSLYSFLNTVNESSKKIITVEDPVEYVLEGVNQVQVASSIGMTFAQALRAMMRQSPNIIMVGEIRDAETAEIAINASLTGHLVFSTLHTNDAPGAVTRLVDIGIKPFLVSSAVNAVMAQRLVRKVCRNCAEPYVPDEIEKGFLNLSAESLANGKFAKGRGCSKCSNTGYKGRMGIFEIFRVTEEIQHLITEHASHHEIREAAIRSGMRTLREDGIMKATAGLTTLEEIIKTSG